MKVSREQKDLWGKMARLTEPKCAQCKIPYTCCSPEYCDIAIEYSKEIGEPITPINKYKNKCGEVLPLMGEDKCECPPHIRPLCTLHVCSINSIGHDPKDPQWTEEYFALRNKLEIHETE